MSRTALIGAMLAIAVAAAAADPSSDSPAGYWQFEAGGDVFDFHLVAGPDGGLSGTVHSTRDGVQYMQAPVEIRRWDAPRLALHMPETDVGYEGEVDAAAGIIRGALVYADGSSVPMDLVRSDPDALPVLGPRGGGGEPRAYRAPEPADDGWTVAPASAVGLDESVLAD